MTEATHVISHRREERTRQPSDQHSTGQRSPRSWRIPRLRTRVLIVAAVYAVFGFLAGAMLGAFVGWFLLPACVGALLAGLGGAWLEQRD